jgi:4-amino-4-deoxy-L-arabinose transferase-like glycosyltransferase
MAGDLYGTESAASFDYSPGILLGLLPVVFGMLLFLALNLKLGNPLGSFLGASVITGTVTVVVVEILSIPALANRPAMAVVWSVLVLALVAVLVKGRQTGVRTLFRRLTAVEWTALAVILVLLVGELVVSQAYLPNTQDSLSYHLARVEHWRVNQSVGPYPAMAYRQVAFAPGAEYLVFTLRVLADSFWVAPLVQWACGLGCVVATYRIAGQLGCGRSGRMLAALLSATAPGVVLAASGTSNDLVAAFYLLAFASFVLQYRDGGAGWQLALVTGLALGLAVLAKSTAVPIAVGFGLWWAWLLLRRRWPGLRLAVVGGLAAVAIAGPYLAMETAVWGSPIGPSTTDSILVGSHDPVTIAMNTAKILSAELVNVDPAASNAICLATVKLHRLAGRDVNDPATEFGGNKFVCKFIDEEVWASNPWQTVLIVGAILALLAVGLAVQRTYAIALTGSVLVFMGTISYQPWITRLLLGALLLGCPLVPVAIGRLASKWPGLAGLRAAAGGAVALAVIVTGVAALDSGAPRPFAPSMFRPKPVPTQLLSIHPDMAAAVRDLQATGARRIGLIGYEDVPEFALWVTLGAIDDRTSIVVLESGVTGYPAPTAAAAGVDAVLCVKFAVRDCDGKLPQGWRTKVYQEKGSASITVLATPPATR